MEVDAEDRLFEFDLKPRHYLRLFWSRLWLIVVCTIAGALFAFVASQFMTPVYRATAILLVDTRIDVNNPEIEAIRASDSLARTYQKLLESPEVVAEVIAELDLAMEPDELVDALNPRYLGGTRLINVDVNDSDPEQAAMIANTVAEAFIRQNSERQSADLEQTKSVISIQLDRLATQISETEQELVALSEEETPSITEQNRLNNLLVQYTQSYAILLSNFEVLELMGLENVSRITQVGPALPPAAPSQPDVRRNTVTGALLGFGLSVGAILVVDFFDDRVRRPDDVRRRLGLPVLGQIVSFMADNEPLITLKHPRSPAAESFRSLRLSIRYASVDKPLKTLLITSPLPDEGKSTSAANLAVTMANSEEPVVLLDGDMRRPQVHRTFSISNSTGFSSLFVRRDDDNANEYLHDGPVDGLQILPAGPLPPNPSELLDTRKSRDIVAGFADSAHMVIVDGPPVMDLPDALALAQYADGVLLILRANQSRFGPAKKSIERLRGVGANILGVAVIELNPRDVTNGVTKNRRAYAQYYEAGTSDYEAGTSSD